MLLGCLAVPGAQSFQLVGYRLASRHGRLLCIDLTRPLVKPREVADRPVYWMTQQSTPPSPRTTSWDPSLVSGAVDPSATTVVVRYELDGQLREQPAAVLVVRDPRILQTIEVDEPMGHYLAEVPSGARGVGVEARDGRGRPLGVAFFSGFPAATGQGRACSSRPQITDVRLVEPARKGSVSRLRVTVCYPAGRVTSVAATTFVQQNTTRTKLTQTQQGARVVTLPLRFDRRRLLAVDVTAHGLPADNQAAAPPRCLGPPRPAPSPSACDDRTPEAPEAAADPRPGSQSPTGQDETPPNA